MSRHFSREAFLRLLRGPANEAETVRAIRHVMDCRRCRASGAGCLLPERTGDARNALVAILEAEASGWVEVMTAESWWEGIKDLSPEGQIKKIRSTASLQSLPVFEAILADARAAALADPFLGESMVRAALTVADLLPEPRHPRTLKNDLRGEVMTVVANCRRLAADFPGSAAAIEEARRHLAQGTGDPGLEAALLSIHCSLCTDRGDFEKALVYVRRAVEIYRELEDWQASRTMRSWRRIACSPPAGRRKRSREPTSPWSACLRARPGFRCWRSSSSSRAWSFWSVLWRRFPTSWKRNRSAEQADPATRLRAVYCEARLLDGLDRVRESEKLFRKAVKAYFDQELYKEAFLTLLTLFECLCRRGALGKAAALCEEAIAATSQAGSACNEQIRCAWEELLEVVRVRQLSESELIQARQYLVRNWSVAAGTFTPPAAGGRRPPPQLTPRDPGASALAGDRGVGSQQLSGGVRRVRTAVCHGGPGAGRRQPQRGLPPARNLPQYAQGEDAAVRAVSRATPVFPADRSRPTPYDLPQRHQRLLLPPDRRAFRVVLAFPDGDLGLEPFEGGAVGLVGGGAVGGGDGDDDARFTDRDLAEAVDDGGAQAGEEASRSATMRSSPSRAMVR